MSLLLQSFHYETPFWGVLNAEIQFSLIHDRHVLDSLIFCFLTYKMGDIIAPSLLMVFMGLNIIIVKKGFAHTDLVLLIKY